MRKRLLLLGLCVLASSIAVPAKAQWVRAEKTDAFTGIPYSEFILVGKFLTPPQEASGDHPPALILDCIAGEHHTGKDVYGGKLLSSHVNVGAILHGDLSRIPVMFRLDDGKPHSEIWSSSTNSTAAFFPEITLNTIMYSHFLPHRAGTNPPVKKLVIAVDEALAARIVMQFDMADPTEVEKACGVTYVKN